MERFFIVTNEGKDKDGQVTGRVKALLEARGKSCTLCEDAWKDMTADSMPKDIDCAIVIGGDGTLIGVARLLKKEVPIMGINMGTLGYLAEIDQYSIYPAMDRLMSDRFTIEKRMMLFGTLIHEGQAAGSDIALNDIVISREGSLRVVRFNNYVNDTYLNTYKADGIIISTPTGSTGYSLSAGGPIISPAASMILMTPLAPHTLNTRSIVFSPEDVIEVELGEGRDGSIESGMAYFDGAAAMPMVTGDRIRIEKSTKATRIIKINNISFLETLRKKMRNN